MVKSNGIRLKKRFGQHFLRDESVVRHMSERVSLNKNSYVFEIGCGDGFLTKEILRHPIQRLQVFEIDDEWASYVKNQYPDNRLQMNCTDFLTVDRSFFKDSSAWVLLANLPYQVTFPILYKLHSFRDLLDQAVIMIQEEVAQKIVKKQGRDYGFPSLFFQWYFEISLLEKVSPTVFVPAPKVYSRLLYMKPRINVPFIDDEEKFWSFVKQCFKQPRRTLINNLKQSHIAIEKIPSDLYALRAQQMTMEQFLVLWAIVRA